MIKEKNINYNNLRCIKLCTDFGDGTYQNTYITYERWYKSFVSERWEHERRYGSHYNKIFGYVYDYNTVRDPFTNKLTRRTFIFPHTTKEAIELDKNNRKN